MTAITFKVDGEDVRVQLFVEAQAGRPDDASVRRVAQRRSRRGRRRLRTHVGRDRAALDEDAHRPLRVLRAGRRRGDPGAVDTAI